MVIRELSTPEELEEVVALQTEIWSAAEAVPGNQLVIAVKSGGHVLGAYVEGRLAAFVYGFPALLPGTAPWIASHILATAPRWRDLGLGQRLKWRQREWALARGYRRITWTADPLEARNAHVNLNRLGALGVAYLVNCYGEMDDPLNAGAPSDRLLLEWCLESPRVEAARQGKLAAQGTVRVPIPANVHALRRDDRAEVRAWRFRVRDALVPLLEAGHRVTGFDRAASSLLLAPAAAAEEGVP